ENREHVFTYVNTVSSGKAFPQRCVRTKSRAYLWNAWSDFKTPFKVEAMSGLTWNAMLEAGKQDEKLGRRVFQYLTPPVEQFFDEESDPDERVNLFALPTHRPELERMKALLLAEMERSNDPLLEQFRDNQKPLGREAMKRIETSRGQSLAV